MGRSASDGNRAPLGAVLGITSIHNQPVVAWIENHQLHLTDITRRQDLNLPMDADEVMATGGRIYIRQGDLLMEVSLTELPTRIMASVDIVGNVLGQSHAAF